MTQGRTFARIAAAAALALAAPVGAIDVDPYWLAEVPPEYRGRWNTSAHNCRPFDGRHRLLIEPRRIVAGGDAFRISYVGWVPEGGIVISSEYVGPAKSWKRTDFLRLEKNKQILVGGRAAKRVRCP